jgi:hypothetical protein
MVLLPSTGVSRYHNCCIDGDTNPEYFGCTLVYMKNFKKAKSNRKAGWDEGIGQKRTFNYQPSKGQ